MSYVINAILLSLVVSTIVFMCLWLSTGSCESVLGADKVAAVEDVGAVGADRVAADERAGTKAIDDDASMVHAGSDPLRTHIQTTMLGTSDEFASCRDIVRDILSDRDEYSVEIGPGCAPTLDPNNNHHYFIDMHSTEELQSSVYGDPEAVVRVDYVWAPGQTYRDIVPDNMLFDNAVSVHSIEHVPCIISYLNNVSDILKTGGRFVLVVPDRRYTFDHFRSRSSLGEVIACHLESQEKPNMKQILDCELMMSHNEVTRYWSGDIGQPYVLSKPPGEITQKIDNLWSRRASYKDVHVWTFDPISFVFMVEQLRRLNLISFEIEAAYETKEDTHEFLVVMRSI